MNYSQLQTAVQDTTENTFSAVDFATMVEQVEQKIYNAVQLPALRKNVVGTLTAGNQYLTAPMDFLSVFSMAVIDGTGSYTYLLNKDVNFIRQAYPVTSSQGMPKYYSIFGPDSVTPKEMTFILGPTPSDNLSVELHYFYYPTSIVTAGSTWLGDNFDSALYNGVLVEAIRFMKGEADMVALYTQQFQQSMGLLKQLSDGKLRQDSYRSGQVRDPVS